MTPISERQRARLYIYKKEKKSRNIYIYIQKARHFPKSKIICVTFYSYKYRHLTSRTFSWKFWNWHWYIYIKHDTLCYVKVLYTKSLTLCKKQDNLRYDFCIQKAWHFVLRNFSWNFWNWRRGEEFLWKKIMHFVLNFYIQKTLHFLLHFISKQLDTLRDIFICNKQCNLRYVCTSKTYSLVYSNI